jgi:hypothetical protein
MWVMNTLSLSIVTTQRLAMFHYVGFDVLIPVVMSVSMFWEIVSCSPCENRRFGGMYDLHIRRARNQSVGTRHAFL